MVDLYRKPRKKDFSEVMLTGLLGVFAIIGLIVAIPLSPILALIYGAGRLFIHFGFYFD